jgi:transcriptional regulator NrdR family protein
MRTLGRRCPKCQGDSRVIDVRHEADATYRRRACVECEYRWTTRERDEPTTPQPQSIR